MRNFNSLDGPTGTLLRLAVSALALLAIPACTDSTDNSALTPTPPSVVFGTPPAAMSTDAGDQPSSSIMVDLGQDPTPYPTSTPYPTATPYPAGAGGQTFGDGPSTQIGPSTGSAEGPGISIAIPKKTDLKHPNAGSALNGLVARVEAGEISAEEAAREAPLHQGESVGVIIYLSGNVGGVIAFLEANGASSIVAGEDYIEAFVPVLLLGAASEQQGVQRVRLIQPPESPQSGPGIEGNGTAVHGSTAWNLAGYSGQGIKIGVVDSGFSGLAGLKGTEVPSTVQARCYNRGLGQNSQNLSDCEGGGTHGTAVAESVMDIAPEASLYISNPRSLSELRNAVDWMISEGASVINHSRMWQFDGPGDGTSPISISPLRTIDRAVAAGIVWVNAAGNQGPKAWFKRGPFSYTTVNVDGEDIRFINFDGSEFENPAYVGGRLELRWEDSWGRATRDLDLVLVNPDYDQGVLYSINPQTGEDGHVPYESVGTATQRKVLVAHHGGSEPGWIQLLGWGWTQLEFNTPDTGSIVNPAESANPGMLAVGAAHWNDVNAIRPYSSRGPTPDGRVKPDVVAADCGETAADHGPFCGTSQASPHVAGMVALVRQRFPNYTPAQVTAYIKDNAEQRISNPDPNNTWGHGFFVLPLPIQPLPSLPGSPAIASVTPGAGSLTVSWRAPVQTGGSTITAYDLRHIRGDAPSKADGSWNLTRRIWAGSGPLSYAISGLDEGTRHNVQVRAVNSAGEGPWSATATGTPTGMVILPGTPGNLTATGNGPTRVDLSWSAPSSDGGAPISGYRIEVSADQSFWSDLLANTGSASTSYSHTGLTVGSTRHYRVSAINLAGTGPASNIATGTTVGASPCATEGAVADAANNPELVSDCETLLVARDILAGTATLNWSDNTPIANWNGISVSGTPQRVTLLYLSNQGLTGTIPAELGGLPGLMQLTLIDNQLTGTIPAALGSLTNLTQLHLFNNQLTGTIPAKLGGLTNLQGLELYDNQLTGEIPAKLGGLTNLQALHIESNQLTGAIPAELGSLTNLKWLTLHDNHLTGEIPEELGRLNNLTLLYISGNRLTGCIPAGLRDVRENDHTQLLRDPGIPYCDVLLSGLSIARGTLSPQFDPYITAYTAAVSASRITVTPSNRHNATFQYLDGSDRVLTDADGGQPGHQVDVPVGMTAEINIKVTFGVETEWASQVYTIQAAGPGALGAPAIGQITTAVGSLTVAWNAPSSNGGSPITVYDLRYIETSADETVDSNWTVVDDVWTGSGALSYQLSGLTGDVQYDVQVRAVNAAGEGPWSAAVKGTTAAAATTPGAPKGLTATADGQTQIDLSWTAPSDDGGAAVTGYRIEVSSNGSTWTNLVVSTGNTGTSYSHTGLTAGSTRHYRVSAINSAGTGPASDVVAATTGAAPAPDLVVDRPTVDTGDPEAGARFTLNASVRNQGNGPSNSTTLRYYQSSDSTITTGDTEVGTDSVASLDASESGDGRSSLTAPSTPGIHYYGACVDSVSGESDIQNNCSTAVAVTVGAAPAPDLVVDRPTVDTGAPEAGARFTLNASVRNQGNGSSDSTTLRYHQSGDSTITTGDTEVGTDSVFRLDALESGDESISLTAPSTPDTYYYGACVDSVSGESDIQNNCSTAVAVTVSAPANVPRSPTGLTATANGQTRIDLSWRAPSDDGGAAINGYRIEVSEDNSNWSDLAANTGSTAIDYPHTGLTAGSTRHYRVSAINSVGTGPASNTDSATTESAQQGNRPPQVIGDVDDVTAKVGETFTVDISRVFNDPDGDEIVDYGFASSNRGVLSGGINTRTGVLRLTAVKVGGTTLAVDAKDSHGLWSASQDLFVVTVVPANPGAPTGLTAAANGQTEIDLSWKAPSSDGGAAITGYRIEVSSDGSSWSNLRADTSSTATGYSHTGLDPNTTGHYRVSAINSVGTGEASGVATATTDPAPLVSPDLVVESPSVSEDNPDAGGSFTLGVTVRNQGNGPSNSTTLRYYRSVDSSISTSADTEVGTGPVSALATSGTSAESISLTAQPTEGSYYYGACVDVVSEESSTHNNCSSGVRVVVGSPPLPDLVVSSIMVDNSNPYAGTPFNLTTTILNQGDGPTSEIDVIHYRSTDPTITTSDSAYLGTFSVNRRLDPSEAADVSREFTAPAERPGLPATNYYGVCVVPPPSSGEANTQNNCSTGVKVTVIGADLVVESPTVGDSSPDAGTSFTLGATVRNLGGTTPYVVTLRYYRSSDSTITTDDSQVGMDSINPPALAAFLSSNQSISLTAPSDTGTYYYGACVDGAYGETNTQNNCSRGVAVAISESNQAPGTPTDLTATANGQTRIDLAWTPPSDDGGADITGYRIEVSTDNSTWSDLVANTNSTTISYSHTGLAAGSSGHYRVSAINSAGIGPASNIATATTDPPDPPGPPTGLTATANGQTKIDLSWNAPSNDGGADVTGYRIEVSPDGSSWSDLVANTSSATTSYSHTGLTAETTRHYRVSAINSAGTGTASNVANATTEAAPEPEESEAVTISLTSCSVDEHVGGNVYRFTLEGTVSAARAVSHVSVVAHVDGNPLGSQLIGDMEAGESEEFSISGPAAVDSDDPPCRVEVTWVE